MDRCVLDTSVIVKSIFEPMKSLSEEIFKRENETHKKCRYIIKNIEENDIDIYIPRVCVVETAAVVKNLGSKNLATKISRGVIDAYDIVDEAYLFDTAWKIALDTGCSGFDSYFIALARIKNAVLFTDDGGMNIHSGKSNVESILIRDADLK